jgi:hypothetical protein
MKGVCSKSRMFRVFVVLLLQIGEAGSFVRSRHVSDVVDRATDETLRAIFWT